MTEKVLVRSVKLYNTVYIDKADLIALLRAEELFALQNNQPTVEETIRQLREKLQTTGET